MAGTLLSLYQRPGAPCLIYRCGLLIAVVADGDGPGQTACRPDCAAPEVCGGVFQHGGAAAGVGPGTQLADSAGHRPQLGLHFVGLGLGISPSLAWRRRPWTQRLAVETAPVAGPRGCWAPIFWGPHGFWMLHASGPCSLQPLRLRPLHAHRPGAGCDRSSPPTCAQALASAMGATYTVATPGRSCHCWPTQGRVGCGDCGAGGKAPSCFCAGRAADAVETGPRADGGLWLCQMVSASMPIATDHAWLNVGGAMLLAPPAVGIVSLHAHPDRSAAFRPTRPKAVSAMTLAGVAPDRCARHGGLHRHGQRQLPRTLVVTALVVWLRQREWRRSNSPMKKSVWYSIRRPARR